VQDFQGYSRLCLVARETTAGGNEEAGLGGVAATCEVLFLWSSEKIISDFWALYLEDFAFL
jgi:hypothetical protein